MVCAVIWLKTGFYTGDVATLKEGKVQGKKCVPGRSAGLELEGL
jgi:hypothetical protein